VRRDLRAWLDPRTVFLGGYTRMQFTLRGFTLGFEEIQPEDAVVFGDDFMEVTYDIEG